MPWIEIIAYSEECLLWVLPLLCLYLPIPTKYLCTCVSETVGIHNEVMMPETTACYIFLQNVARGV